MSFCLLREFWTFVYCILIKSTPFFPLKCLLYHLFFLISSSFLNLPLSLSPCLNMSVCLSVSSFKDFRVHLLLCLRNMGMEHMVEMGSHSGLQTWGKFTLVLQRLSTVNNFSDRNRTLCTSLPMILFWWVLLVHEISLQCDQQRTSIFYI